MSEHDFELMSAGIDAAEGCTQMTDGLGEWADAVYAMDGMVEKFLKGQYGVSGDKVINLQIPDAYDGGDPALASILRQRLAPHVPEKKRR